MQLKDGVINQVPHAKLRPDPNQPRKVFDDAALALLAESMKNRIEVPLKVRMDGEQIIIVDGERRWRAAKIAKIMELPCILEAFTDVKQISAAQLATAVQRESLKPIEIGEYLLHLRKSLKLSDNQLLADLAKAGVTNVGPGKIENYIRLTELPDWAKRWLRDGTLVEAHGTTLLRAIKYPAVMKECERSIRDAINWKGGITAKELQEDVEQGFDRVGIDLNDKYGRDDEIRQFPISVCEKCEFMVKIGKNAYCMNKAEFAKKNEQALALKAEQESKKAKEKDSPDRKPTQAEIRAQAEDAKRRNAGRFERMKEYLDRWLRPKMQILFATELNKFDPNAAYGIALWLASGSPEESWGQGHIHQRHQEGADAMQAWAGARALFTLPDFIEFSTKKLENVDWNEMVNRALICMTRDQVRYVAQLVGFDLKKKGPIYRVDDEYLRMKRKAELQKMAKVCKGVETVANLTGTKLRELLLQPENREAIGVPDDIAKIFDLPMGWRQSKASPWKVDNHPAPEIAPDVKLAGVNLAAALKDAGQAPAKKKAGKRAA